MTYLATLLFNNEISTDEVEALFATFTSMCNRQPTDQDIKSFITWKKENPTDYEVWKKEKLPNMTIKGQQ